MAARQHGLVTVAQLGAAGLDKDAIARRVRSGRLHRLRRGVYAVGHTALSREAQFLAAVLTAGEGAALSGLACAELYEVRRWRAPCIDVVAPKERRVRTNARIHKARLHRDDVTVHKGIPCTTIARLVVDLTDQITSWEIANVIHEAAFRGLFRLEDTCAAIERGRGRKTSVAKKAVQLHLDGSAGVRSRGELRFLIALERDGLPEPRLNTDLNGHEVDFHWPALKLAIEFDGPHHARTRTQRQDERKAEAWRSAGYELLRFAPEHVGAALRAVTMR
ncbi:type IV toxin-antitoxin system AbiEi family antitoxin domain-containing protein [Solirubrobacter sp. CPCC 204708]|uniref:Type IV toxin-antitoxin system AbiEi family antitoxin domain-containing protein n=1 Tax=Solirubrobacter deserti TaxID=2282478 RepID=A0ABT4RR48_9ACTN|nr:type IV toxin-antitoxin system AbiEi family antitoxin domain-containing protein [Solirubrobacter deserti]MBE2314728.1 type IV toxin-antitoxin system AbiEi family antitoxin domain-containing protein [Solirubrobacter deserti]MDA0141045.1 type IV toxin-antitoxin system AbiEi family antitoxin domain-containing protein [Solirubrobacter deserti]